MCYFIRGSPGVAQTLGLLGQSVAWYFHSSYSSLSVLFDRSFSSGWHEAVSRHLFQTKPYPKDEEKCFWSGSLQKKRKLFPPKHFPSAAFPPADFLCYWPEPICTAHRPPPPPTSHCKEDAFNQAPLEWGMLSPSELHGDMGRVNVLTTLGFYQE